MQKHPAGRGAFALRKTRVNLYKMHKGVLGENVQKQKIKAQNEQSIHVPGRPIKEGVREFFCLKTEKWLDNRGFRVYTALVSHNGLVRQKGSLHSTGRKAREEKFVKNAELPSRIRVDLCVSAQI